MSEWIRAILDLVLIGMVGAGLVQAIKLIKHLTTLQQSRGDMERFVRDFNATVLRAEIGIKNLKTAARDSGDDLEKLVEKAHLVRDELQLIVESADRVAERLSQSATHLNRPDFKTEPAVKPAAAPSSPVAKNEPAEAQPPSSRAEKELLQALQKLS